MENLRTLYFALGHHHLNYGIIAWGNTDKCIIKQTNILQKRPIRIIIKATFNSHTNPKFKKLEILKLNDLFEYKSHIYACMHIMHMWEITQFISWIVWHTTNRWIGTYNKPIKPDNLAFMFLDTPLNMHTGHPTIKCQPFGINGLTMPRTNIEKQI